MDFELSKEQAAIQKAAVEFGKKRILPIKKELIAQKKFPRELIQEIGALGFLGGPIPAKYGGTEVEIDDEEYLILGKDDVLAIAE